MVYVKRKDTKINDAPRTGNPITKGGVYCSKKNRRFSSSGFRFMLMSVCQFVATSATGFPKAML